MSTVFVDSKTEKNNFDPKQRSEVLGNQETEEHSFSEQNSAVFVDPESEEYRGVCFLLIWKQKSMVFVDPKTEE